MPPVIACTARTMPEEIAELLAAGFASHLAKPIDTERLRAALAGAARAARQPEPAEA
jgi:CheY-like chemotaxis protein